MRAPWATTADSRHTLVVVVHDLSEYFRHIGVKTQLGFIHSLGNFSSRIVLAVHVHYSALALRFYRLITPTICSHLEKG